MEARRPRDVSDWTRAVALGDVERVVAAARSAGYLDDAEPALVFHDLGRMRARFRALVDRFPPGTLHAVAIKANPLVGVLGALVEAGAGLEAASIEEVHLALAAGCPPGRVVFDSPAKTRAELAEALALGVALNADNLAEVERIAECVGGGPVGSPFIGLRVNPLVGAGRIGLTSVADAFSKFGVRIDDPAIFAAFERHPWLTALHVHVGSQGCDVELIAAGVRRAWELRAALHARLGGPRIATFDVGGGLPVAYRPEDRAPTLDDYVGALRGAVPELFSADVRLVTELGRAIHAPCGWAVSRVESVKRAGDTAIATIHLGGDLLVRRVLRPQEWHHELVVLDPAGRAKPPAPAGRWTIAGPLCFGGDLLARDAPLPPIAPGDLVLIRDVGAYTVGTWSRHCSRALPTVLGYEDPARPVLRVLRRRERPADVVAFWSPPPDGH